MLEIMSIGDLRIRRVVPRGQVAQKCRDHLDGLTAVIEEFDRKTTLILSASANRHPDFSLSVRKMGLIHVRTEEERGTRVVGPIRYRVACGKTGTARRLAS
jgi:hypothetical protein